MNTFHARAITGIAPPVDVAGALEEKSSIPMVRAELEIIIELQTDEFWQDITTAMLEDVQEATKSGEVHRKNEPAHYLDADVRRAACGARGRASADVVVTGLISHRMELR